MALNITVAGDTLLNDVKTDCYYQVYYYPHNFTSKVFATEDNTYNFNIGGVDHLGKEGEFKKNNVMLINLWKGTPDKSEITHQSVFRLVYDGEGYLYINNLELRALVDTDVSVQVLGKHYIHNKVTPSVSISSLYQWSYKGVSLYQRPNWYGFLLNPITSVEAMSINFDYGSGLVSDGFTFYSTVGTKTILLKLIDGLNREYNTDTTVDIYYEAPEINLDYLPKSPDIDDDIILTSDIVCDTNIECRLFLDDSLILSYVEAQRSINVGQLLLASHKAVIEVIYNDGFKDKQLIVETPITMRNMPPEVQIEVIEDRPPILKLNSLIENRDDDIKSVQWIISQIVTNNGNGIKTKVQIDVIEETNLDYVFTAYGDMLIELIVTDVHNAIGRASYSVSLECGDIGIVYVQDVEFIQTGVITQDFTQKLIRNSYRFTPDTTVEDFTQKILKTEVFDEVVQDKAFTMYKVEEI